MCVLTYCNHIGVVIVSVLTSVDHGFEPPSGQKTIKLVFVASPLSIKEIEEKLVCSESG